MTTDITRRDTLFSGTVDEKLKTCAQIINHIDVFVQTSEFQTSLKRLQEYADTLNDHMTRMKLGRLCIACAVKPGGSCCSSYMSNETDAIQLALNCLIGVQVKKINFENQECCFLGRKGCIFLFKPMFCLNYLCSHILSSGSDDELHTLEQLTGKLLRLQYRLEQDILRFIETV